MSDSEFKEVRRWRAVNLAAQSEGSIHDDAAARSLGFRGGFVGGVTLLSEALDAWRETTSANRVPYALTFQLEAPVYEGEEIGVLGKQDGDAWQFVIVNEAGTRTSTGQVRSLARSTDHPTHDGDGEAELPELDRFVHEAVVEKRVFELPDVQAYEARTHGGEVTGKQIDSVPAGMWANPMRPILEALKVRSDIVTMHRSSSIDVNEELQCGREYLFHTAVSEARLSSETGKGFIRVHTDISEPDGAKILIHIEHKSAVRLRA